MTPYVRGVFPIDSQLMADRVDFSDELTHAEQEALQTGNLETLPDNSPTLYLLEGGVRPGLSEAASHDYGEGVLSAVSVLRAHLRKLARDGHVFPEPTIDMMPAPAAPEALEPRRRAAAWVGTIALYPFRQKLRRIAALMGAVGEAATYFDDDTRINMSGILGRRNMRITGLPFASDKQVQRGNLLPFWLGAADSLELYHTLYAQQGVEGERSTVDYHIAQDDASFTRRDRRRDTWPEAGLTEPQEFNAGSDHNLNSYRACGYRASIETDGKKERADLWWAHDVPGSAKVTRVRTFEAQSMLVGDKDAGIRKEDVAVRLSLETARLQPRDMLIVQGKDGQIFGVRHPFTFDDDIVKEETGTVTLLRLCQFGEVMDLVTIEDFVPPESLAELEAMTKEGVYGERVPLFRRAARIFLKEYADDLGIVSGTAANLGPSLHLLIPAVSPGQGLWGTFLGLFAGARLWRYFRNKRSNASISSK